MTGLAAPPAAARPLAGIALMLAATLSFVLLDGSAKYLADRLPVVQLVWARYTISLALLTAALPLLGGWGIVSTNRPVVQCVRGFMLMCATASIFTAMRYLPMADAYAISFISPAIVAALAIPVLGERVSVPRWTAIGLGFLGVLIVIRPGSGVVSWPAVFPLAMATFYAIYQVMTRAVGASDPPLTTLFYTMLVGTAVSSVAMPFVWAPIPDVGSFVVLIWMGVIGIAGQFALITAFAKAPASVLAPIAYTQIVWAAIGGFLVFGDIPDFATIVGSLVVIASGLILTTLRTTDATPRRSSTMSSKPRSKP